MRHFRETISPFAKAARWVTLSFILAVLPVMVLGQEPVPITDPFPVNTLTLGYQNMSSVSMDGEGNFVVVWKSYPPSAPGALCGRRYDANGNALGPEVQLNSEDGRSLGPQASVAKTADGGFVVAWRSHDPQDGSDNAVFVRRFDSDGQALGGELRLSQRDDPSSPEILQVGYYPRVAATADGGFVAVWDELFVDPGTAAAFSIKGRRYDPALGLLAEFQVDEDPVGPSLAALNSSPAVAGRGDGLIICWQKYTPSTGESVVHAKLYDSNAAPLTREIPVSSPAAGTTPLFATVAALPDGSVVLWRDSVRLKIFGQRLDPNGVLMGEEIEIGPSTEFSPPSVSPDEDGDFVVVWPTPWLTIR